MRDEYRERARPNAGRGSAFQGKVNAIMAKSYLQTGIGARIASVVATALTLMVGISLLPTVDSAHAQKKPAEKKQQTAAAQPQGQPESAWVRLCDKGTLTGKDKEGKELKKELDICMTLHEQIDANSGMVLISAGFQQVKLDGKEKEHFSITVPLGMSLPYGLAVTVFPKDIWDKVQKREKLAEAEQKKLKSVKLGFSYCIPGGCSAEVEANSDLISMLKDGAGFVVEAVRMPGTPVGQLVSLSGFNKALSSPPTDSKKFKDARNDLMKQIAERRKQLIEEMQKQQNDLNKMQPNVTPEKAPAAQPPTPKKK
jgi:invasion protein IalB